MQQQCPTCQLEVQEGFEYCHYCGASVQQTAVLAAGTKSVEKVFDDLKRWGSKFSELSTSVQGDVSRWLGSPISSQRQILYALMSAFTILLTATMAPWSMGLIPWLEGWLLLALVLLLPISYWTTGVIPFSGLANAALGEEMALRRRIFFSILLSWKFTWPAVDAVLNGSEYLGQTLSVAIGSVLIAYYFMGLTSHWHPLYNLQASLQIDGMHEQSDLVAEQFRDAMRGRGIRGLEVTEVEMSKLRHLTAGDSSGTRGRQIVFTRGRARVAVFIQDFGDSLFVRWSGHFNKSGRRLWLMIGIVVSIIEQILRRWTGLSSPDLGAEIQKILTPASRHRVLMHHGGGLLARTLGLIRGVSEYAMNDLFALIGTTESSLVNVVQTATSNKYQEDEIRRKIRQFERQEAAHAA